MNILLINPSSENELFGNNPKIVEEERGYNPPLGLLYVAAYLETHSSHHVEVLDCQVDELSYEEIRVVVERKKPDVVGITAYTFTLLDVIKTVCLVKEIDENIKVVLGGPHVNLFPEETIDLPGVDYLVLGEGEVAFCQLVNAIRDSNAVMKVKGLVFKDKGAVVRTDTRGFIENLDELPFPARQLTHYKKYSSLLAKRSPVTTMITSRGCPYRCQFCNRPHLGKKFRCRSAVNVVDEMEACVKLGIHEFLVYDDTFTVNRERMLKICEEITNRQLDIGWDIRARVDNMDADILAKLKEANCERIHYGVEAGTEKILKILKKDIILEQVRETFRLTKEAGISTLAYFMIGSPTETREDIEETFAFMKEIDPDFVHITILCPFPGTPLYLEGLRDGQITSDYWREFSANPTSDFRPPCWEATLSAEELNALLRHAYKSFYGRPTYILRQLAKIRSPAELARKVGAGLNVLFWR